VILGKKKEKKKKEHFVGRGTRGVAEIFLHL
jgi:hypothetical protein